MMEYSIEGNPEGETLILVHGWPDNSSVWENQTPSLKSHFRCVLITLPNFGDTHHPGGFKFQVLIERLNETILKVQLEGEVIYMGHDWGAFIGYLYEQKYPKKIRRMVMMDVGGQLLPNPLEALLIVCYQWTLASLWIMGGVFPAFATTLSQSFARLMGVPQKQSEQLRSSWNYPYFYLWRAVFFPWFGDYKVLLMSYRPQSPILYLYGGKKPLMFHSKAWLRLIDKTGGKSECIPEGDHWFLISHHKEINPSIVDWLKSK